VAKVIEANNPHTAWEAISVRSAVAVFLYGLGVGLVTYGLYLVLERFIFDPILCRESTAIVDCDSTTTVAAGMAIVIGSILGLVLLVRERIYRPMLAILGVGLSLWGVFTLVAGLPLVIAAIIIALLYGVAYALFSWLSQPANLVVSVAAVLVVAVLARLALS
jgi:hypothetical protein